MADENKSNEEEYQLNEEDNADIFNPEAVLPEQPAASSGKRNIILIIVVIGMVLVVYKLSGFLYPAKYTKPAQPAIAPIVQPQPIQPIKPEPKADDQADKAEAILQATSKAQLTQLGAKTSQLSTRLDTKTAQLEQQLAANTSQVATLAKTLDAIKDSINSMDSRLGDLDKDLTALQKEVAIAKSQPKRRTGRVLRRRRRRTAPPRGYRSAQVYYIQAIIPGQAWLMSKNGTTLTVSKGSNIPGYGFVRRVDVKRGMVLTSSGRTIRYAPEER